MSLCYAALTALLASCSANLPVQREAQQAEDGVLPAPFMIVCVIHGDGDYLYHDTNGIEHKADEEALAGAQSIARHNPQAEVFIFHRRPREHFLFVFPRHDGEFYYYRNGRLIANELYWRDQEHSPFDPEVELYRRFREDNQRKMASIFLYCGHEIPEFGGVGYDASYPDRPFTIQDLADPLRAFTRDSARFDLMLLSTCFGGTPHTIGALGSFARYIIASPDNLHLSYFDFQPLERLDLSLGDGDVHAFAKRFARRSFDRLTREIQTAVSVSVYDVDRVQGFLRSVQGTYEQTLSTLKEQGEASMSTMEHCDCADLPAYVMPTLNEGIEVFYRPARFGRSKHKQAHSGWECWRQASTTAPKETDQR
ncbi:MAG: Clostripain family [Bacteroidetes bacterium]|nr:Clostripain family [Bacteroidota bacterium]